MPWLFRKKGNADSHQDAPQHVGSTDGTPKAEAAAPKEKSTAEKIIELASLARKKDITPEQRALLLNNENRAIRAEFARRDDLTPEECRKILSSMDVTITLSLVIHGPLPQGMRGDILGSQDAGTRCAFALRHDLSPKEIDALLRDSDKNVRITMLVRMKDTSPISAETRLALLGDQSYEVARLLISGSNGEFTAAEREFLMEGAGPAARAAFVIYARSLSPEERKLLVSHQDNSTRLAFSMRRDLTSGEKVALLQDKDEYISNQIRIQITREIMNYSYRTGTSAPADPALVDMLAATGDTELKRMIAVYIDALSDAARKALLSDSDALVRLVMTFRRDLRIDEVNLLLADTDKMVSESMAARLVSRQPQ